MKKYKQIRKIDGKLMNLTLYQYVSNQWENEEYQLHVDTKGQYKKFTGHEAIAVFMAEINPFNRKEVTEACRKYSIKELRETLPYMEEVLKFNDEPKQLKLF